MLVVLIVENGELRIEPMVPEIRKRLLAVNAMQALSMALGME
jgi:hypothetical protein